MLKAIVQGRPTAPDPLQTQQEDKDVRKFNQVWYSKTLGHHFGFISHPGSGNRRGYSKRSDTAAACNKPLPQVSSGSAGNRYQYQRRETGCL